jgi:hypothetical protein
MEETKSDSWYSPRADLLQREGGGALRRGEEEKGEGKGGAPGNLLSTLTDSMLTPSHTHRPVLAPAPAPTSPAMEEKEEDVKDLSLSHCSLTVLGSRHAHRQGSGSARGETRNGENGLPDPRPPPLIVASHQWFGGQLQELDDG